MTIVDSWNQHNVNDDDEEYPRRNLIRHPESYLERGTLDRKSAEKKRGGSQKQGDIFEDHLATHWMLWTKATGPLLFRYRLLGASF